MAILFLTWFTLSNNNKGKHFRYKFYQSEMLSYNIYNFGESMTIKTRT